MKKKINKKRKLIYLIIILILFLSGVQLVMAHCLATTGEKMRHLEERAKLLEGQNLILSEEINEMGSLIRIATEAARIGLVKADNVLNLIPQIPVALEKTTTKLER